MYLFEEYFLWECIYLSECIYGSIFIYLWEDIYLREYIYLASKCICGSMRRVVWWEEEEGVWREEEIINLGTLCLVVPCRLLLHDHFLFFLSLPPQGALGRLLS